MARQHTFIRMNPKEARELKLFLSAVLQERGVRARRRGQAIWFSSRQGGSKSVDWIADHFRVHRATVWEWFRVYKEKGLEGLKGTYYFRKL